MVKKRKTVLLVSLVFLFSFTFISAQAPNLQDGTKGLPSLDSAVLGNITYNVNYTAHIVTGLINSSYYLKSNPFGFYNSTDFDINDYRLLTNLTFDGGNASFDTNTLFIDSTNHRVGIGTSNPHALLGVDGTALFGDGSVTSPEADFEVAHSIQDANTEKILAIFQTGIAPSNTPRLKITNFRSGIDNLRYIGLQSELPSDGSNKNLALNPEGGNVGIGTTSPTQPLHVQGNLNVTGNIYVGGCIIYNYNTTLGVCL